MPVGADGFRLPSVYNCEQKCKLEWVTGPGQDDFCRTFVINGEDHTLGNILKHVIMQNPDVSYCGYTVPHPMDKKIHLRIQTNKMPALDVLHAALKNLKAENEAIKKIIKDEVSRYQETHP
ncbi:DNA-directed RNA polymerases I and III subunit RPAC2 [Macrobrachium rosenbergii]|uniref:DNA-directed RNA polymerases I and III subunit RPAC2 n=1 Tax=Macrobrachium rosenbergii TaxID=79674 RepID=UPI0034D44735